MATEIGRVRPREAIQEAMRELGPEADIGKLREFCRERYQLYVRPSEIQRHTELMRRTDTLPEKELDMSAPVGARPAATDEQVKLAFALPASAETYRIEDLEAAGVALKALGSAERVYAVCLAVLRLRSTLAA